MIMIVTHTRWGTSLNYGKGRTAFSIFCFFFFGEVQTEVLTLLPSIYFGKLTLCQRQFEVGKYEECQQLGKLESIG